MLAYSLLREECNSNVPGRILMEGERSLFDHKDAFIDLSSKLVWEEQKAGAVILADVCSTEPKLNGAVAHCASTICLSAPRRWKKEGVLIDC